MSFEKRVSLKRWVGLELRRGLEWWRGLERWWGLKRRRSVKRRWYRERWRRFERWRAFQRRRRGRHILNGRPYPLARDHRRLIENAGDGCQCVVGRVVLTHDSASGSKLRLRNRCPRCRPVSFPRSRMRLSFVLQAQFGGIRCFQGLTCSSWPARRNNVPSSPKRAENIIPSGNPA